MKLSIKKGFSFGLTSGIITTIGLVVGLSSGTHSKIVVLAGILTLAIANSLSDSYGVHMSEESGNKKISNKEVWECTISTFLSEIFFSLTFIIPILIFNLDTAIIMSIIWGLILLSIFSFYIAKQKKENPTKVIIEHLTISVVVIIITRGAGTLISNIFGKFL